MNASARNLLDPNTAKTYAARWVARDDASAPYRQQRRVPEFGEPLSSAQRHALYAYVRDWIDDVALEMIGPRPETPLSVNGQDQLVEALCDHLALPGGSQSDEGFGLARTLWTEAAIAEPRRALDLERRKAGQAARRRNHAATTRRRISRDPDHG